MSSVEIYPKQRQTGNHISIRSGLDGFTWSQHINSRGKVEKTELVNHTHKNYEGYPDTQIIIVTQEQLAAEKAEAAVRTEAIALAHDAENDLGPEEYEPFGGMEIVSLARMVRAARWAGPTRHIGAVAVSPELL